MKKGCDITARWEVQNQLNLKKYEVEYSKDNLTFTKIGEVDAKLDPNYSFAFTLTDAMKAPSVFLRLKSVDKDGSFKYSKTVSVAGTCDIAWQLNVFPNPAAEVSAVTIAAVKGMFNGKYRVTIFTVGGQMISQREIQLSSAKNFPLSVKGMINGNYRIQVTNTDGTENSVLDFEKL